MVEGVERLSTNSTDLIIDNILNINALRVPYDVVFESTKRETKYIEKVYQALIVYSLHCCLDKGSINCGPNVFIIYRSVQR